MRWIWAGLLWLGVGMPAWASNDVPKSGRLEITAWRVEGTSMAPIDALFEHLAQKGWRIGGKSVWAVDALLVKDGFSQSVVVEKDPTLFRPAAWLPDKVKRISEVLGPPVVDTFRLRVREEYDESVSLQLAGGAPRPTVLWLKWDRSVPGAVDYLVASTAEDKPVCVAASPKGPGITTGCRGMDHLWFAKNTMAVLPMPQADGSWLVIAIEQEPSR